MSEKIPVSEIMTRELLVVEESENLHAVAKDMKRGHFRHLPVIDGVFGEGGRLVGLLGHRNLRDVRDDRTKTSVGMVMTKDVKTVQPNTPVFEAVQTMLAEQVGCLPVVDDEGVLLGIVSEVDLLKLLSGLLNLGEHTYDSAEASFHRTPTLVPTR
ncbi:MAG: CBS domain-containing protein [Polyangiales bacterium]|jgi:CBS domain-containing protein